MCFPPVSGTPAIAGIFGKDWCTNLWKGREPGRLERASDAPQSSEEVRYEGFGNTMRLVISRSELEV